MQGFLLWFVTALVVTSFGHNVESCDDQEECSPTQGDAMVYESASLSLERDDEEATSRTILENVKEAPEDKSKMTLEQLKEEHKTIPTSPGQLKGEPNSANQYSPEHVKDMHKSSFGVANRMYERAANIPIEVAMVQADGKIAQLLRTKRMEPAMIAGMLKSAIETATKAVQAFTKKPPQMHEGIKNLGKDLLEAFNPLLDPVTNPNSGLDKAAYDTFKQKWNDHFDDLPDALAAIEENILKFTENGDAIALIEAIEDIMQDANDAVLMFLPDATAKEVDKFMTAAIGVVDTIGKAWKEINLGSEEKAAQTLYSNLRSIIDKLIPFDIRNNTAHPYKTITSTIDEAMKALTDTTYKFRQSLLTSSLCYRSDIQRKSEPAGTCPSKDYDRIHGTTDKLACRAKNALLQVNGSFQADEDMLEHVVTGKETAEETTKRKSGFRKDDRFAGCDETATSQFPEYHGHYCYAPCPAGFEKSGHKWCKKTCEKSFPVGDGSLCAKSAGLIQQWTVQTTMTSLLAAVEVALALTNLIKAAQSDGGYTSDDAPEVGKMLSGLADIGLNFANPMCIDVMKT